MKKRRHHYVWKFYLKPWSSKKLIWHLREGLINNPNLDNIAIVKNFYKLKELSSEEIKFIHELAINPLPPPLRERSKEWIDPFNSVFKPEKGLKSKKISDPEIDKLPREMIFNFEENFHCKIENAGKKYMELILSEDASFFDSEDDSISFLLYIFTQYFRTYNMRRRLISGLKPRISNGPLNGVVDPENIVNVLMHILSANVAGHIFVNRSSWNLILLKNDTAIEFITGDQPVINTFATGLSNDEAPDELELYYPVSPRTAILLTEKPLYSKTKKLYISVGEVEKFNQSILEHSYIEIYSTSKEILERYIN